MKLYVIGNGFDIHHGLDTKYSSFGLYLKKYYSETYDLLLDYCGFNDLDPNDPWSISDPLWADFETNMAGLNTDEILAYHSDLMPCYASDDFRDRDRYTYQIEMEGIVNLLTKDLYKAFEKFILGVDTSKIDNNISINLDKNAIFLSFNYTNTLISHYKVPFNKINFIHGMAGIADPLILGHGTNPDLFKRNDDPIQNMTPEDRDYYADQYDYSREIATNEIHQYFSKTYKGTSKIIENNNDYFSNLTNINEVYILGHSLSDVDLPYFHKLQQSVNSNAKWIVTFYGEDQKQKHLDTLQKLGILPSNIVVVSMTEI